MSDAFYSWHVGTLVDGRITTKIPAFSTSWQTVMDDAGTMSVTCALADPAVAALNLYTAAEPGRCFLAVAYTDEQGTETFLEAGPVWAHSYTASTRQLQISGAGLWSYFDHRKVLPVLTAGVNPATVTSSFTAALGTIAKQLVQLAATHTGGSVPVVYPADEAGTDSRAYPGYDMTVLGQALRDLTVNENGPELQFVPRRRADDARFIEWVMRAGTSTAPLLVQAGDDWVFDQSAARSPVTEFAVSRDGSAMTGRWWAQGAGTDVSTMFSRADDPTALAAGFPLLEASDSWPDVSVQATLDQHAAGGLQAHRRAMDTFTLTVHRDGLDEASGRPVGPNVAAYLVGDWVSVTIAGDPYLADGTYRSRITSKSGDDSTAVTVALSPSVEV